MHSLLPNRNMYEYWSKSQWMRLLDVFVLGPFMIYYAIVTAGEVEWEMAAGLFVAGVATILYNGTNYLGKVGWWGKSSQG
jgi:hypothetical protein